MALCSERFIDKFTFQYTISISIVSVNLNPSTLFYFHFMETKTHKQQRDQCLVQCFWKQVWPMPCRSLVEEQQYNKRFLRSMKMTRSFYADPNVNIVWTDNAHGKMVALRDIDEGPFI